MCMPERKFSKVRQARRMHNDEMNVYSSHRSSFLPVSFFLKLLVCYIISTIYKFLENAGTLLLFPPLLQCIHIKNVFRRAKFYF